MILEYGSSHWVPWVPWVFVGPLGPGHAPFESKSGNAQETYGLVKRGIETVHFPSSVKLQAPLWFWIFWDAVEATKFQCVFMLC